MKLREGGGGFVACLAAREVNWFDGLRSKPNRFVTSKENRKASGRRLSLKHNRLFVLA